MFGNFKFHPFGIFGVALILIVFVIIFLSQWNIYLWYFIASLTIYSLVNIIVVWSQEYVQHKKKQQQSPPQSEQALSPQPMEWFEEEHDYDIMLSNLWRIKIGCYCAFVIIIVCLGGASLVLHLRDIQILFGFFVASIASGMAIPFLLFTRRE